MKDVNNYFDIKQFKDNTLEFTYINYDKNYRESLRSENNTTVLRLLSQLQKGENGITYCEGKLSFLNSKNAIVLSGERPNEKDITLGIDMKYLNNKEYMIQLLSDLLREEKFTSKRIDVENGTYEIGGNKYLSGDYVGELIVSNDKYGNKVFQKSFNPVFANERYNVTKDKREQRKNENQIKSRYNELEKEMIRRHQKELEDLEQKHKMELNNLRARFGLDQNKDTGFER